KWKRVLIIYQEAWGMDDARYRAGRIFAPPFSAGWNPAWDLGEPRRCNWTRHSRFCRNCANRSVARVAGAARAVAFFWNQRSHCGHGAFSLRPTPDCSKHRDRFAGHPARITRVGNRTWTKSGSAALADSSAYGFALHSRRNQNERCDQCRDRHSGGANWRRRPGRTDPERPQSERSRNDPPRRDSRRGARVAGAIAVRFARSRFDSKRTAFIRATWPSRRLIRPRARSSK